MNSDIQFYTIFFLCLVSLVSAENIGTFQLEDDLEIYQECNNCTYCNFTRVKYPNGTNFLTNLEATADGTYYYSTILGDNITEKGTYSYCYDCGNLVEKDTGCLDFEITYNGHQLTTERGIIYIGLLTFLTFLFVLNLFMIPKLPNDTRDEDGYVIHVSSLKHLKPILMTTAWLILLSIVFLSSNVAIAYLPFEMFGKLLFNLFILMGWATVIIIPVSFIFLLLMAFRSKEMKRLMQRGVEFHQL